jgi:energy-coupling factor transporter ATP-binding protein EcfA2
MAVNDLPFSVGPGVVTGFLGPNGAGKTTTMRMILGQDGPTQGSVTIGGRSYRDLPAPMREVGALPRRQGAAQWPPGLRPPAMPGPQYGIPRSRYRRCSASSVWREWPGAGRKAWRWAWASGSASPRRYSGTQPCSSSTNR